MSSQRGYGEWGESLFSSLDSFLKLKDSCLEDSKCDRAFLRMDCSERWTWGSFLEDSLVCVVTYIYLFTSFHLFIRS